FCHARLLRHSSVDLGCFLFVERLRCFSSPAALHLPMCSTGGVQTSLWTGCPIRSLRAPRSHAAPPERFAGLRVLHRPSAPRHPPRTLSRLYVHLSARSRTRSSGGASTHDVPSSSVSLLSSVFFLPSAKLK